MLRKISLISPKNERQWGVNEVESFTLGNDKVA